MNSKLRLTSHSIEQILNKIPENIRPSIDDYLNIYYKIEDKDIILNSMFIIKRVNYFSTIGMRRSRNK